MSTSSGSQLKVLRRDLAPYAQPHLGRAVADIATSVVPYAALSVLMYLALDFSYVLALALAIPAAGFLVRRFIVFHDCAHGSFLPSKRANAWLGSGLGVLVFESFASWRHSHAVHHATAGDLDRRGVGDVHTITVAEYRASQAKPAGLSPFPEPSRDVRARPDLRDGPAAPTGPPERTPPHPA